MANCRDHKCGHSELEHFNSTTYKYTPEDFKLMLIQGEKEKVNQIIESSRHGHGHEPLCSSCEKCDNQAEVKLTNFDSQLEELWESAMNSGDNLFRFKLRKDCLPYKVLPGNFNFIVQLNPDRAQKRRKPVEIQSLHQPFNPDQFNFNKINPKEILMRLRPHWCSKTDTEDVEHLVLINVSPLEYCHVLLTPFRNRSRPQRLSREGLRLTLELCLLTTSRNLRFGFNSLCGFASVNHEHYHAYYLSHRLFIESTKLIPVFHDQQIFQFENSRYPPGFCFVLSLDDHGSIENSVNDVLDNVMVLVRHLEQEDIAHNVFITRGSTKSERDHFDSIRIFIWSRISSFGAKGCDAFNPALCELGGHFSIKNEEAFICITEEFILNELHEICDKPFEEVRNWIISSNMRI